MYDKQTPYQTIWTKIHQKPHDPLFSFLSFPFPIPLPRKNSKIIQNISFCFNFHSLFFLFSFFFFFLQKLLMKDHSFGKKIRLPSSMRNFKEIKWSSRSFNITSIHICPNSYHTPFSSNTTYLNAFRRPTIPTLKRTHHTPSNFSIRCF